MKKIIVGIIILIVILSILITCKPIDEINNRYVESDPGSNAVVMSMTTITLDGSGSTGNSISYLWSQTAGTTVTLSSNTSNNPTFISPGLTPGTSEDLIFSLTVDDGDNIATAFVTINVLTWKQVDIGMSHTLALRSDGTIWAWGNNSKGQIGQGNTSSLYVDKITQIGTALDWKEISAGDYHNLALNTNGEVYAWGDNHYGQIGDGFWGSGTISETLVQSGNSSNWMKINARDDQSYAISFTEDLFGWGKHFDYHLGLGQTQDYNIITPTEIKTGMSDISGGGISSLAVYQYNTLWGWGDNTYGQLAVPDTTFVSTDVPDNSNGLTETTDISAGGQHSYIIRFNVSGNSNYTLWSVGDNSFGQLGTNDPGAESPTPGKITATGVTSWNTVAAGKYHGLAIGSNGTLWSWGFNDNGQLGLGNSGTGTERTAPEQVGTDTNWYAVSAWEFHSAGLKDDGTLWVWGRPTSGVIGDTGAETDINNSVSTPWRVGY